MATATAVAFTGRPTGNLVSGSFTLDPGSIAAGAQELETVTIPGVVVGDTVVINPAAALTAGLIAPGYVRVSAPNTVIFSIENNSAGAIDQASGTWYFTVLRGTSYSRL
jgi:hypothetical protein